jgi:hypothetical protein
MMCYRKRAITNKTYPTTIDVKEARQTMENGLVGLVYLVGGYLQYLLLFCCFSSRYSSLSFNICILPRIPRYGHPMSACGFPTSWCCIFGYFPLEGIYNWKVREMPACSYHTYIA